MLPGMGVKCYFPRERSISAVQGQKGKTPKLKTVIRNGKI